ncbi:MAG: efflux RND transporter periplasmic adaptor subunit [Steroidobacter sp.]
MTRRSWIGPLILIGAVVGAGTALAAWKHDAIEIADTAATNQPEPMEAVAVAVAREHEHNQTTTSIGTVVALRSITVRNELPGTVRRVSLVPGQVVEAGMVLVALDVSVEEAELKALQAQTLLAETQFARMQRMVHQGAASEMEVDTARAERDVALAQMARTRAVIERKTIRAPFRARVGISDVHPGQYLNEGALLTTLQGVDDFAYVDFSVAQQVAANLHQGDRVNISSSNDSASSPAEIVAIDARVDPATRNAAVRARVRAGKSALTPGSSVRVRVAVGSPRMAVAIPASALRKGPGGDHVFVLVADKDGKLRANVRQVKVDAATGDEVVIEQGLEPGERVAASGSFKLRDSALVAIAGEAESVAFNSSVAAGATSAGASL